MKKIVSMAELKVGRKPDVFTVIGLGSCVAVALYHEASMTGGLAHIMLPEGQEMNCAKPGKYVNTAIKAMFEQVRKRVGEDEKIVAKLAGGSQMFQITKTLRIGNRNVDAAKKVLKDLNIGVVGEDTGKNYGRTVIFYTENGQLKIKSIYGERII